MVHSLDNICAAFLKKNVKKKKGVEEKEAWPRDKSWEKKITECKS